MWSKSWSKICLAPDKKSNSYINNVKSYSNRITGPMHTKICSVRRKKHAGAIFLDKFNITCLLLLREKYQHITTTAQQINIILMYRLACCTQELTTDELNQGYDLDFNSCWWWSNVRIRTYSLRKVCAIKHLFHSKKFKFPVDLRSNILTYPTDCSLPNLLLQFVYIFVCMLYIRYIWSYKYIRTNMCTYIFYVCICIMYIKIIQQKSIKSECIVSIKSRFGAKNSLCHLKVRMHDQHT